MDTNKFPPRVIYNIDVTVISPMPNKPSMVISTMGKCCVNKSFNAERRIILVNAINALEHFILPALIFDRMYTTAELLDGAPGYFIFKTFSRRTWQMLTSAINMK